ncbi:MAG: hypothetical protein RBU37_13520, partial [Myxococcota bacterium]|nr:hypothetical protein [Myxococcota bacterium]
MNQDAILPTHLCSSWLCPIKLAGALTITALLMASGCSDSPPSTPIDQSDQAELTELTETTDLDPELDGVELPDQDPELDSLDDDADAELPPTCVPGCNEAQLTQCDEEGNPIVSDCTVACVAEGEDFYCSCAGDQDCPEGSYCDPRGLCVDEPCVPGSAVCQDSVALQCLPDGSGYARVTCEAGCRDGVCLCTQDEDCAEQEFCDPEGNCLARLCVPDALFCDGAALVLCDERGAAFSQLEDCGEAGCLDGACGCTSSADCPPSQFCAPGVGPEGQNLCQDDLCPAGTRLCVDGSLSACSDDGGTLSTIATCAQGCVTEGEQAWCACTQTEDCETEQFCDPNGHCIGAVCDPALATCDGNVAVRCTPDGSSEIRQNCGSGVCDAGHCLCTSDAGCAANQHCDTSAGQCVDDLCLQGSSFCDGRDRRQCSSNGSSSALLETCSLGCVDNGTLSACRCNNTSHCPIEQYCHPNAFEGFDVCRPDICNAGDYGCDGNTSVTCAADGGSELRVSCGLASCVNGDCVCSSDAQCIAAQYCSPFGRCEADLCNASTLYCLGDDVLLCDSRGVESTLVQGCEPGQCAAGTCVCTGSGDCAEHESCDTGVCVCDSGLRCGPSQSCCLSGDICEDDACKIPCSGVRCGVDERLCCPEACETLPSGVAFCVEPCSSDVDCPSAQHCNGSYCIDDICTPGQSRCAGNSIERCNARGSAWLPTMNCGSDAYFLSSCVDLGGGQAACTCEDDWDCPAYTVCEQGACQGTGVAPTCRLPAEPFSNVLPTPEIVWGGVQGNRNAVAKVMQGGTLTQIETSPFPNSNQVVHTPLVANLDDDNGDGLINEADFPEIIFLTFCNSEYTTNGVLRAIHGGGPNKGRNYFANCGSSVWHEGDSMSMSCTCSNATIDSTSTIAVGDLDYDGIPEIVAVGESNQVFIYDNTGELIASNAGVNFVGANPAAAIANVDNIGNAEIIIGRHIFTVERNSSGALVFVDRFDGTNTSIVGRNGQGPASCVANLVGDERLELITGSIVYRFPEAPPGVSKRSECAGPYSNPDHTAYCAGKLVVAWDGVAVNGSVSVRDGFCAIADVLGADRSAAPGPSNPLDGKPEVILIAGGRLEIFGGDDGVIHRNITLTGSGGGAPNVDDFDGDGFPE